MIEIEINSKKIKANAGEKLIEVCDRENIPVPRFCYHKDLSIAASCRMCLIDVENSPKPQPACSTPVFAGMKVSTTNETVKKSQQAVMEFLLINHPLDCPICDQGGECELQDVAVNYGGCNTSFSEGKRVQTDKDIGPLIQTDMTRCIHCTRCVRFGDEIAGISEMGSLNRGDRMSIGTVLEEGINSELSGNMIDICPVGALTSKPFRFALRSWEMSNHQSIARHDLCGSNINIQTFKNKVYRVVARENTTINNNWISDRDRFSYQGLYNDNRVLNPKIKLNNVWSEVGWTTALDFAVKGLKNNAQNNLTTLVDKTATLEELYLLKKLTKHFKGSTEYRLNINNIDNYSYLDSSVNITQIKDFKDIVIIGGNIRLDEPMINYRIRKAVLGGSKVRLWSVKDFELNYDFEKNICLIDDFANVIKNSNFNEDTLIILGEQINFSGSTNNINFEIKQKDCKVLNLSSSGNTLAARKVGFTKNTTLNTQSYILFNLGENDLNKKLKENIKNANFVIGINSFTGIEDYADVMLPLAGIYETSGTFINIDNIVQSFAASVEPRPQIKAGWKIIKVLADMLEIKDFNFISSVEVKNQALINTTIKDDITKTNEADSLEYQSTNCYQTDEFVRNSSSLQQTIIGAKNVE